MSRKRLLRLTWIGSDGEPYHTDTLSPRTARDVLARGKFFEVHGIDPIRSSPLYYLSWAEAKRARRALVARDYDGREVMIEPQ